MKTRKSSLRSYSDRNEYGGRGSLAAVFYKNEKIDMKNLLLVLSAVLTLLSLTGFLFLFLMRNSGLGIFVGIGTGMTTVEPVTVMVILAISAIIFAILTLKILKWKKTDNISE